MSTKIRKKIAQEKLCQYYVCHRHSMGKIINIDHVVKNVHLVWTLKWNKRV